MRITFSSAVATLLLISSTPALSLPQPQPIPESETELVSRDDIIAQIEAQIESREALASASPAAAEFYSEVADVRDLWKRKGGGGGGGKGGTSSSGGSSSSRYASTFLAQRGSSAVSSVMSWRKNKLLSSSPDLFRRKGGGGGRGGGGSGRSSSSSSSNTQSSSSSGKGGSSSSLGSSSSSTGGRTKTGSGVTPAYGGGRYYGGGASVPYASGARSPLGIAPVFLGVGVVGALALYHPLLWPYGAYSYPYTHPYTFRNHSATNTTNSTTTTTKRGMPALLMLRQDTDTGVNQTKPVTCLCALYEECGCDDDGTTTFLDSVIGTGDYFALNQTLVTVVDENGTSTILINGTLPNGTTASGGTESASGAVRTLTQASGYWVMIALVGCTVFLV